MHTILPLITYICGCKGEMLSVYTVCGLLAILLVCGAQDNTTENNCVSSYQEFEKKVFIDNTQNRFKLYQVFYPQNGHLPYGVDVVYETLLPNKTVLNITYTDFKCTTIKWRWISSPIFLFVRPRYLNELILLTLNYFREWTTPSVTLKVPYPCPNSTFDLLTQMTSLVDEYAIGKVNLQTPSGNVLGICRNNVSSSIYHKFPPHGGVPDFNYYLLEALPAIYLMSLIFGDLLMWIGSVLVLKWNLKDIVKMSYTYSYKHYGLWWGVTCFWFILVPIMLYSDVSVSIVTFLQYGNRVNYTATIIIIQVSLVLLTGLIIAGYYAHKTKPPAVPNILLKPVVALLCCCNTQRAKSLVFGTALWINVVAAKLIMFFTILVILATLAEPFAVITNTLLLILVAFCITNILALLFTIFAYLFTPKHLRPQGQGKTMLRAVVLIPLLAMIICLCMPVLSIGYLTNRGTKQDDIISLMGSVALPLILGAITYGLKKLITKWLGIVPDINQPHEVNNNQPLEEYVKCNKSVEV